MGREEKAKTVYWLDSNLYLNITNKCSNSCGFCIRNFRKGVGGFNLKLETEPSAAQVISELDGTVGGNLRKLTARSSEVPSGSATPQEF